MFLSILLSKHTAAAAATMTHTYSTPTPPDKNSPEYFSFGELLGHRKSHAFLHRKEEKYIMTFPIIQCMIIGSVEKSNTSKKGFTVELGLPALG